jgi:histone H3/H4
MSIKTTPKKNKAAEAVADVDQYSEEDSDEEMESSGDDATDDDSGSDESEEEEEGEEGDDAKPVSGRKFIEDEADEDDEEEDEDESEDEDEEEDGDVKMPSSSASQPVAGKAKPAVGDIDESDSDSTDAKAEAAKAAVKAAKLKKKRMAASKVVVPSSSSSSSPASKAKRSGVFVSAKKGEDDMEEDKKNFKKRGVRSMTKIRRQIKRLQTIDMIKPIILPSPWKRLCTAKTDKGAAVYGLRCVQYKREALDIFQFAIETFANEMFVRALNDAKQAGRESVTDVDIFSAIEKLPRGRQLSMKPKAWGIKTESKPMPFKRLSLAPSAK